MLPAHPRLPCQRLHLGLASIWHAGFAQATYFILYLEEMENIQMSQPQVGCYSTLSIAVLNSHECILLHVRLLHFFLITLIINYASMPSCSSHGNPWSDFSICSLYQNRHTDHGILIFSPCHFSNLNCLPIGSIKYL